MDEVVQTFYNVAFDQQNDILERLSNDMLPLCDIEGMVESLKGPRHYAKHFHHQDHQGAYLLSIEWALELRLQLFTSTTSCSLRRSLLLPPTDYAASFCAADSQAPQNCGRFLVYISIPGLAAAMASESSSVPALTSVTPGMASMSAIMTVAHRPQLE